ncbi:hypothetical protein A2U01_0094982, partial [Trifolium medium]|nr:hypothetical protein [Trifolium medium]
LQVQIHRPPQVGEGGVSCDVRLGSREPNVPASSEESFKLCL